MNHNLSGHLAEFAAGVYYRLRGYRVIARNYVTGRGTKAGEIDFIAVRGTTIVFAEVKKRGDIDTAAYAIKPAQQTRIRIAAENFVAKHPAYQNFDIRFDAVLVSFPCSIRCIENAF